MWSFDVYYFNFLVKCSVIPRLQSIFYLSHSCRKIQNKSNTWGFCFCFFSYFYFLGFVFFFFHSGLKGWTDCPFLLMGTGDALLTTSAAGDRDRDAGSDPCICLSSLVTLFTLKVWVSCILLFQKDVLCSLEHILLCNRVPIFSASGSLNVALYIYFPYGYTLGLKNIFITLFYFFDLFGSVSLWISQTLQNPILFLLFFSFLLIVLSSLFFTATTPSSLFPF